MTSLKMQWNDFWEDRNPVQVFFFFLGVAALAYFGWILLDQGDYYFLPVHQKALHPSHSFLRSSGSVGLSLGVLAAFLFWINLSYLVRKKLTHIRWLGDLRTWMAFHVLTGITGPLFVLLHSDFLPRSSMGGVAFFAMIVLVLTGMIGRYIYQYTPRSVEGKEMNIDELRKQLNAHKETLEGLGLPSDFFAKMVQVQKPLTKAKDSTIPQAIMGMIAGNMEIRAKSREFERTILGDPILATLAPKLIPVVKKYYRDMVWIDRYYELRGLMSGWRFYHRWVAIMVLGALAFHVLIAVYIGHVDLSVIGTALQH